MARWSMFALLALLAAQAGWAAEKKVDPEPPGQGRKALMKGTWELSSTMLRGRLVNFGGLAGARTMKFEKDQVVSSLPVITSKSTWKIDPKKKPMTIDLTANGQTIYGLFKVEKDQLTLAISPRGQARPTAIDNTAYLTFVLKRKGK